MIAALLALGTAATFEAQAQNFPDGPVKIVTSVGPGAAPDIISRMVADHLTQLWGQQVIVLNQPGGAGAVAIKAVAPATPDGHTLYMALASNFIALPELQKNFPVDVVRDFVPIGFVGEQPLGIAVTPALGVNTLPELIALLKSKPGEFNVAAGNRGSILHLAGEWLRSATGTKFTLLHYTGGAKALPDVLGGRVQVDSRRAGEHARRDRRRSAQTAGGHDRASAFAPSRRCRRWPRRCRAIGPSGWMALMAPPGTPAPLAHKISDDLRTVLVNPTWANASTNSAPTSIRPRPRS